MLPVLRSLISIDGSEAGGPEVSEREAAATARTMECIRSCNVAAVFADCAYLRPDSLLALAEAVVWASGGSAAADGDTDTMEVGGNLHWCNLACISSLPITRCSAARPGSPGVLQRLDRCG